MVILQWFFNNSFQYIQFKRYILLYFYDGEPFIGAVDKLGTAYEDAAIATGLGAYMATPLLRDALQNGPLDEESAKYDITYYDEIQCPCFL